MQHNTSILLCSILFLVSCKGPAAPDTIASGTPDTSSVTQVELPADFIAFYEKFHTDSLFQINHISWPLEGANASGEANAPKTWTPDKWRMMRGDQINSGEFNREVSMVGDFIVVERIKAKAVSYGVERRFSKTGQDWQLIYYSGLREFK